MYSNTDFDGNEYPVSVKPRKYELKYINVNDYIARRNNATNACELMILKYEIEELLKNKKYYSYNTIYLLFNLKKYIIEDIKNFDDTNPIKRITAADVCPTLGLIDF